MDLSSNELFHFTRLEYLKSILDTKSFIPRFSLEFVKLSDNFQHKGTLIPIAMVCFCDIPFEQSKKHRERYGNYGIVLTEKWKLTKGLNPVFYVQSDSFLANVFSNFTSLTEEFKPVLNSKDFGSEIPLMFSRIGHNLSYTTFFLKQFENKSNVTVNYEGATFEFERRRFYDEREWRFIPFEADNKNELFLSLEDFSNSEKLNQANDNLRNYKLTFELDDIKYLIVNTETEKEEIIGIAKDIFGTELPVKLAN